MDPWGFDEQPVETWAEILRPQAFDLLLLTLFLAWPAPFSYGNDLDPGVFQSRTG